MLSGPQGKGIPRSLASPSLPRGKHLLWPRHLLLVIPLLFLGRLALPLPAWGGGDVAVPATAPAPLRGAGSVVLVSHVVDVRLLPADGRLQAEVEAVTKLHNTSKTAAAQVTFGWPTWAGGEITLPPEAQEGLEFAREGRPLAPELRPVETAWGEGQARPVPWWITTQSIPRDARVSFRVRWRQALDTGPLVTLRVGLLPAARWPGPVGSVRVTLHLPELGDQEQIVWARPAEGMSFDGYRVEWVLADFEPADNLEVALIAPPLWQDIVTLRRRVADAPGDANAWLLLAERYASLADAGAPSYGAQAEAALLAAAKADPTNPEPHRRLWDRYRQDVGDPPDPAALQEATEAAEAYVLAGGTDPAVRAYAVNGLLRLAELWVEQGAPERALVWVERAEQVAGPEHQAPVAEVKERALAQTLAFVLQQEGIGTALTRARELGLSVESLPFPWGRRLRVLVRTERDRRTVVAEWVSPPVPDAAAARVQRVAAQLASQVPAGVTVAHGVEGPIVRLSITVEGPPETWPELMAAVEALLPQDENLDVVRSVLRPTALEWSTGGGWLEEQVNYREVVTLQSRAASRAETLRQSTAPTAWERLFVDEAATVWERLAASQEAVYEVQVKSGSRLLRSTWRVKPPATEELTLAHTWLRAERLAWLIAGGVGLLMLALALIWRWPMRAR